jgi:hypothetical protein
MTLSALFFIYFKFPESPKFLYAKGRFKEAKEAIYEISKFNGVNTKDDFDFIYDTEIRQKDPLNVSRSNEI